jgi:hypothetical protein
MQKYVEVVGLGRVAVEDKSALSSRSVRRPSRNKELHRETIEAWHNAGYGFSETVEVIWMVFDYLARPKPGKHGLPDRPPLSGGMYIDLAKSVVGVNLRCSRKTGEPVWRLAGKNLERCKKRLRSFGLDPETRKIIDLNAAAWGWYQLRTKRYYSQTKQILLTSGDQAPPNINVRLKFDYKLNAEQAEASKLNPTQQQFKAKAHEHFEQYLDGYVPDEQAKEIKSNNGSTGEWAISDLPIRPKVNTYKSYKQNGSALGG